MDLLNTIKKLVSIPSSHNRPLEILGALDFCVEMCKDLPVQISRFESNGSPSVVIANATGKEFDVIFLAHIDVVDGDQQDFEPKVVDGKFFGRGVMDMKAFAVTSLFSFRKLVEEQVPLKVALVLTSDEETGGFNGAKYLVAEVGLRSRVVLVPDDGEDINTIVTKTKSIAQVEFKARGCSAHACQPQQGVNAIELLMNSFAKLKAGFSERESVGQVWDSTMNLGLLEGGVAANEVPSNAKMIVDFRCIESLETSVLLAICEEALVPGVTCSIVSSSEAILMNENSATLKLYADSIKKITGREARFVGSGGGTDGRHFAAAGMEIIVHQANGQNPQGENECVEVDSLEDLVSIQTDFVRQLSKSTMSPVILE